MARVLSCGSISLVLHNPDLIAELSATADAKRLLISGDSPDIPVLRQLSQTGSIEKGQVDRFEAELTYIQGSLQPFEPGSDPHAAAARAKHSLSPDGVFVTHSGRDLVAFLRELCDWARMEESDIRIEDSLAADLAIEKRRHKPTSR